jgi:hypothetical protein
MVWPSPHRGRQRRRRGAGSDMEGQVGPQVPPRHKRRRKRRRAHSSNARGETADILALLRESQGRDVDRIDGGHRLASPQCSRIPECNGGGIVEPSLESVKHDDGQGLLPASKSSPPQLCFGPAFLIGPGGPSCLIGPFLLQYPQFLGPIRQSQAEAFHVRGPGP